jgi:hypothetical protein
MKYHERNQKRRDPLRDLDIDGRVVLLQSIVVEFYEYDNMNSGAIRAGNILDKCPRQTRLLNNTEAVFRAEGL